MADISKITPLGSSTTYDLKDARSLWRSGGTMTGMLTTYGLSGTADIDYGPALPQTGTEGQIFFQLSQPYYELPNGGTSAQFLRGDRTWSNTLIGPLYVNSNEDVGLNQNGALIIGDKTAANIAIDGDEIMARNNGTAATLYLNYNGGDVDIRSSLYITKSAECGVEVNNTQTTNPHAGFFGAGSSGNLGIYDRTYNKWVVYSDPSGNVHLNGSATHATTLTSLGTIGSSTTTHATALQNYFDTYKASTPRNQLINFYDSSSGNGSITFGYFLNGYDSNPYGGFFSAHYNWAYYTGINNGTYTQYLLAKSTGSVGNSNSPIYVDSNGNLQSCNNKLGAAYANGYWGMATADNNTGGWIRTTSQGIIPYQSGGKGGGHQYLGTSSWYFSYAYIDNVYSNKTYGAVWNDYAEFRITKEEIEPGRCIKEVGDDTMILTTKRLEAGCEIVSDTFGFAIGETDEAKTPTAASGRVLAYPYENREEFRNHIGEPVCSGPNGTVSIMTHEEEKEWPSRIIGTISAIPDYEIWHAGGENENSTPIKVNGRVWIRIR